MARSIHTIGDEPAPGFTLVDLLGKGGFGEAWKATGPGGTEVCVKIITDLSPQKGGKELRALKLVKSIRHPNICSLIGLWLRDADGHLIDIDNEVPSETSVPSDSDFLGNENQLAELIVAMELADKSLSDYLEEERRQGQRGIDRDELLTFMEDAARAIDYLNKDKGVQHCDIKPQNILLVGGAALIADFGLAKAVQDARETSMSAVSMAYVAPEVIVHERPSQNTDQYSLAISYYELRTGKLPFRETGIRQILSAKEKGSLDFSMVTDAEQQVLTKATAIDPRARYSDAARMMKHLRRCFPKDDSVNDMPFDTVSGSSGSGTDHGTSMTSATTSENRTQRSTYQTTLGGGLDTRDRSESPDLRVKLIVGLAAAVFILVLAAAPFFRASQHKAAIRQEIQDENFSEASKLITSPPFLTGWLVDNDAQLETLSNAITAKIERNIDDGEFQRALDDIRSVPDGVDIDNEQLNRKLIAEFNAFVFALIKRGDYKQALNLVRSAPSELRPEGKKLTKHLADNYVADARKLMKQKKFVEADQFLDSAPTGLIDDVKSLRSQIRQGWLAAAKESTKRGDNLAARTLLNAFLAKHPSDTNAKDLLASVVEKVRLDNIIDNSQKQVEEAPEVVISNCVAFLESLKQSSSQLSEIEADEYRNQAILLQARANAQMQKWPTVVEELNSIASAVSDDPSRNALYATLLALAVVAQETGDNHGLGNALRARSLLDAANEALTRAGSSDGYWSPTENERKELERLSKLSFQISEELYADITLQSIGEYGTTREFFASRVEKKYNDSASDSATLGLILQTFKTECFLEKSSSGGFINQLQEADWSKWSQNLSARKREWEKQSESKDEFPYVSYVDALLEVAHFEKRRWSNAAEEIAVIPESNVTQVILFFGERTHRKKRAAQILVEAAKQLVRPPSESVISNTVANPFSTSENASQAFNWLKNSKQLFVGDESSEARILKVMASWFHDESLADSVYRESKELLNSEQFTPIDRARMLYVCTSAGRKLGTIDCVQYYVELLQLCRKLNKEPEELKTLYDKMLQPAIELADRFKTADVASARDGAAIAELFTVKAGVLKHARSTKWVEETLGQTVDREIVLALETAAKWYKASADLDENPTGKAELQLKYCDSTLQAIKNPVSRGNYVNLSGGLIEEHLKKIENAAAVFRSASSEAKASKTFTRELFFYLTFVRWAKAFKFGNMPTPAWKKIVLANYKSWLNDADEARSRIDDETPALEKASINGTSGRLGKLLYDQLKESKLISDDEKGELIRDAELRLNTAIQSGKEHGDYLHWIASWASALTWIDKEATKEKLARAKSLLETNRNALIQKEYKPGVINALINAMSNRIKAVDSGR